MPERENELTPRARVTRTIWLLDQLAGIMGAIGLLVCFLGVAIVYGSAGSTATLLIVWPVFGVAGGLLLPAILLLVSRHGISRSRTWAPRLARRVCQALCTLPFIWIALSFTPLPIGSPLVRMVVLFCLGLLSAGAFGASGDLTVIAESIDSLTPATRRGFDPVFTPPTPPAEDPYVIDNDRGPK